LENAVNEYITYWNQKRIKLSLGGLSPVEYRTEHQKAG
ncbi:TPA: IS3 family transposase, partial [Escherichia coli]